MSGGNILKPPGLGGPNPFNPPGNPFGGGGGNNGQPANGLGGGGGGMYNATGVPGQNFTPPQPGNLPGAGQRPDGLNNSALQQAIMGGLNRSGPMQGPTAGTLQAGGGMPVMQGQIPGGLQSFGLGQPMQAGAPQLPGMQNNALVSAPMGNQGIGAPQSAMPINRFNPQPLVR